MRPMETDAPAPSSAWAATSRRIYAGYFALQAVMGIALWVTLGLSDAFRSSFELHAAEPAVTDAFFFADMVVVATSALAAWGLWTEASWTVAAIAFTAGGVIYPTIYLVSFVSATGEGTVPLLVMVGVSVLTVWIGWQVWRLSRV